MSDQEPNFFQELQDEDSICRSMHHLSTAASHHHHHHRRRHHPTTASESPEKYTTSAYIKSTKRQFPSSFQEPVSKRATLHFPSSPSTAAAADDDDDNHLFGFTKLQLPQHPSPVAASPSPLRRTLSEPIHAADATNPSAPLLQSSESPIPPNLGLHQPLQENPNRNIVLQDSFPFSIPNAAPVINRTISDPSPVANFQAVATGGTPPQRPPLARNVSRSPSCGESPSTKRLRRMKERLREMSQWWNQVVREGEEEEDNEYENYCCDNNIHKEEAENEEMENPSSQEAVWVEKNGECLVIHFKCPCGTVYQILLSGNNCYYKLTNF